MGPRRVSETHIQRCIISRLCAGWSIRVNRRACICVNGRAYSFMFISVLSKSVPVFFFWLSLAYDTTTLALNKNFIRYNDYKKKKRISYVWESLCSLETTFTFFLTADLHVNLTIYVLHVQFYWWRTWSSESLIASPESRSDNGQRLILIYNLCLFYL